MSRAMMAFLLMPLFGFLMAIVLDFDFVGTKKVIFFAAVCFFIVGGWKGVGARLLDVCAGGLWCEFCSGAVLNNTRCWVIFGQNLML